MYPLSLGQQSLWLASQLNQDSDAYHEGVAYRVAGPIDRESFVSALNCVVGRHQALRMTITAEDGLPMQIVGPVPAAADLAEFVERPGVTDRDVTAERFARGVLADGYDLAAGPLLRAVVLSFDDRDHVVVLGLHHLICDGWSICILAEELSAAYNAALEGRAADLPELPLQYTDFAVRQRERLGPQELDDQLRYWRGQIAEAPSPLVAGDGVGRTHAFAIPDDVAAALRGLARVGGTSMFMALMAGYEILLAQLTERDDLLVGVPVAGRTDLDVSGLIGCFINLLAFRADVGGDPTVAELLARTKKTTLGNLVHQELPFDQLVRSINPARILGTHPLAQTAFQYLGQQFAAPLDLAGCRSEEFEIHGRHTPFLLSLDVIGGAEGMLGRLYYRDSVLDPDRATDLADDFIAILGDMARNPEQRIKSLPRTGVRLRLAGQPVTRVRNERGYVALRAGVEELVGQVMAQVLGVGRLGRDDDFFDLGGHSLRAGRVVARIREVLGVRVPVKELFEHPTVSGFAARVSSMTRQPGPGLPPLEPGPPGPAAASFAQQRLWFMHELDPASTAYHMGEAYELHGRLDLDALRQAVAHLTERHETLRTRLYLHGGTLRQHVDPSWPGRVHLAAPSAPAANRAVSDFITTTLNQPYDLAVGPLFRVGVLRVTSQRHILVLGIHHIICDGWSVSILLTELQHLYAAALRGTPPGLPPLPVQYRDYARWQHAQLQDDTLTPHLDYWRAHLHGAPTTITWRHMAREASPAAVSEERQVPFSLTTEQSQGLRAMSRDAGVTMFMTLLAVFQVVLARFTGQDDLLIGVPAAGRTVPQTEGLIGFFVNMLALRADLTDDPTFIQLLTRVREHTLSGLAHQDLPFERLVSAVNPERDGDMHPVIQATFQVFEEQVDHALRLPALRADSIETGMRGSRYDLSFDVFLDEDGLRYWITYDERFFDISQIESFGAAFEALIQDVLADPGQPVSHLGTVHKR